MEGREEAGWQTVWQECVDQNTEVAQAEPDTVPSHLSALLRKQQGATEGLCRLWLLDVSDASQGGQALESYLRR